LSYRGINTILTDIAPKETLCNHFSDGFSPGFDGVSTPIKASGCRCRSKVSHIISSGEVSIILTFCWIFGIIYILSAHLRARESTLSFRSHLVHSYEEPAPPERAVAERPERGSPNRSVQPPARHHAGRKNRACTLRESRVVSDFSYQSRP